MKERMKKKLISIITPCYNEEDNVRECYDAVSKIFSTKLSNYDYEHIFCDNASKDNTVGILKELAAIDARMKIIVNSRNFGPFRSTFNGLMHANGDAVVVLPGRVRHKKKKRRKHYNVFHQEVLL